MGSIPGMESCPLKWTVVLKNFILGTRVIPKFIHRSTDGLLPFSLF